MPVSEETYERVALEDPEGLWELVRGELCRKPGMMAEHGSLIETLDYLLKHQLDREQFAIRSDPIRLRAPSGSNHIPDLCVIPRAVGRRILRERPRRLEVYTDALPLVVEVWSPSTSRRDVDLKLHEYQLRGDLEIWLIHPYDRTLTAWRRQPDGTYAQSIHRDGVIQPVALPGVSVDIHALFVPV